MYDPREFLHKPSPADANFLKHCSFVKYSLTAWKDSAEVSLKWCPNRRASSVRRRLGVGWNACQVHPLLWERQLQLWRNHSNCSPLAAWNMQLVASQWVYRNTGMISLNFFSLVFCARSIFSRIPNLHLLLSDCVFASCDFNLPSQRLNGAIFVSNQFRLADRLRSNLSLQRYSPADTVGAKFDLGPLQCRPAWRNRIPSVPHRMTRDSPVAWEFPST